MSPKGPGVSCLLGPLLGDTERWQGLQQVELLTGSLSQGMPSRGLWDSSCFLSICGKGDGASFTTPFCCDEHQAMVHEVTHSWAEVSKLDLRQTLSILVETGQPRLSVAKYPESILKTNADWRITVLQHRLEGRLLPDNRGR